MSAPPQPSAEEEQLPIVRRRPYGQWTLAAATVLVTVVVVWVLASSPSIDWSVVARNLFNPQILGGVWMTIQLSVVSMAAGIALGVGVAQARLSANPILSMIAQGFIVVIRGVPVLVQLLLWGNIGLLVQNISLGIPFTSIEFWSISTNELIGPFTAAIVGLTIHESANMAEIIRSGLLSVDNGQIEAALSIGMSRRRILRKITMPQALRVVIPPTGNQFVTLVKGTSLVSVIAGGDLLTQALNISAQSYRVLEMLFVATAWYLLLVGIASTGQLALERVYAKGSVR